MMSADPVEDGGHKAHADRIAQQVGAERLAALYDMTLTPTAVGLLFCCFPVLWLWPHLPHGLLLGWLAAHLACYGASPWIEQQTGVRIGLFDPSTLPVEAVLIPLLVLLAVLVGIWPAISAYRTDVAKSLGK